MASEQVVEPMPAGRPRRSDEEVDLINRAKGLLISRCSLSEMQAHRCLQKISMETSRPMTEIAQQVVDILDS